MLTRAAHSYSNDDARWQAVMQRHPEAEGRFFYGVISTGIFCKPTCPSRRPARQEGVRFFNGADEAEAAGFRPCRRCCPTQETMDVAVREACGFMMEHGRVGLEEVAARHGISLRQLQRRFRQELNLSPREYLAQLRAAALRDGLHVSKDATRGVMEAGYAAVKDVYEAWPQLLGMTPGTYRRGGVNECIGYAVAPCELGWMLVARTQKGICSIALADDADTLEAELRERFPRATCLRQDAELRRELAAVAELVRTPAKGLYLPLDIRGTAFQRRVWDALRRIPCGEVVSYDMLASQLGLPKGARAVARACAANPLALAVPCHRVVGKDGALRGYRWGLNRKKQLLRKECETETK